jgi:hypothetical protein
MVPDIFSVIVQRGSFSVFFSVFLLADQKRAEFKGLHLY